MYHAPGHWRGARRQPMFRSRPCSRGSSPSAPPPISASRSDRGVGRCASPGPRCRSCSRGWTAPLRRSPTWCVRGGKEPFRPAFFDIETARQVSNGDSLLGERRIEGRFQRYSELWRDRVRPASRSRGGGDLLPIDNSAGERLREAIRGFNERFRFVGTIGQGLRQVWKSHEVSPSSSISSRTGKS